MGRPSCCARAPPSVRCSSCTEALVAGGRLHDERRRQQVNAAGLDRQDAAVGSIQLPPRRSTTPMRRGTRTPTPSQKRWKTIFWSRMSAVAAVPAGARASMFTCRETCPPNLRAERWRRQTGRQALPGTEASWRRTAARAGSPRARRSCSPRRGGAPSTRTSDRAARPGHSTRRAAGAQGDRERIGRGGHSSHLLEAERVRAHHVLRTGTIPAATGQPHRLSRRCRCSPRRPPPLRGARRALAGLRRARAHERRPDGLA